MGKLAILSEQLWVRPNPIRVAWAATAWPRIKLAIVAGATVITAWAVAVAGWFGGQSLLSQGVLVVAIALLAGGLVGALWHLVESRFVSKTVKHRRLAALYYQTAVPALCQVREFWEFMQAVDEEKFGPLLSACNGIVLEPVSHHRGILENALQNLASPPSAIIDQLRLVFQYHWRTLLWIHANMGFVGVTTDTERYKAMMAAHLEFADKMRFLAIQPGFKNLGKVRRTLNRERELIVTPWTVRYP